MKNDVYMIRVIIKKEIVDTFRTLGLFLVALTLCFNLCIYITDTQIIELGLPADVVPYQLGLSMMYLMAMTALFLGTTLTNKMIYEEKRTKTMHMILGMGVPKEVMWLGKILAIVIMCALFGVMNILVHVLFVWVKFGILMKFNSMAITMVFITVPLLCYGFIALASVAYMYFSRMNIVGMFIQIVPYLAVWEVSSELIKFTQVPIYVMLLSLGIGVVALLVSMLLVCGMSKERIVSRVD
ncbi:MAG: hypothetical protein IKJ73_11030 [Lachnospiraceae bacterium]|nr:hypothetical protein [Lachnospiraceae bacterium]